MGIESLLSFLRQPPAPVARLSAAGGVYLVGGCLRDAWLGREVKDIDIAVEGEFDTQVALLEELLGAESFELNQRFQSRSIVQGEYRLDITPVYAESMKDDIQRRDYSVNTLAFDCSKLGSSAAEADVIAVDGAFVDLGAGVLRMVTRNNLAEDPLRVLRGYRLMASLGFTPDGETRSAWRELAGKIHDSAPERIHDELVKLFGSNSQIAPLVEQAGDDGVLFELFPALRDSIGCTQNIYHHKDVWPHTLEALSHLCSLRHDLPGRLQKYEQLEEEWGKAVSGSASAGALARLSMLFHDVAKPATRAVREDGHITFYNHQIVGAEMIEPRLRDLKFSSDEIERISLMIREHLRLGFYGNHEPVPKKLVYRYIRSLGEATPLMILHNIADCMATRGRQADGSLDKHIRAADEILEHYYADDAIARPPVLLDGKEIMELLEIEPGPMVGKLKDAMLEATVEGEISDADGAREFVKGNYEQMLAGEGNGSQ